MTSLLTEDRSIRLPASTRRRVVGLTVTAVSLAFAVLWLADALLSGHADSFAVAGFFALLSAFTYRLTGVAMYASGETLEIRNSLVSHHVHRRDIEAIVTDGTLAEGFLSAGWTLSGWPALAAQLKTGRRIRIEASQLGADERAMVLAAELNDHETAELRSDHSAELRADISITSQANGGSPTW